MIEASVELAIRHTKKIEICVEVLFPTREVSNRSEYQIKELT